MNKVMLIGRLTRDPDIRYTQGDNSMCVARYTLAVDRRGVKNSSDGNIADFISCVAFGKSGEFVEKYLRKGTKVAVSGRIQTGSYTNKEGAKVYTTDVVAEEHEFVESRGSSQGDLTAAGTTAASYAQTGSSRQGMVQQQSQRAPQPQNQGVSTQQNQSGYGQQYGNGGYRQASYNSRQGSRNPGQVPERQGPYNGYATPLEGFMNIPDGTEEELPFT